MALTDLEWVRKLVEDEPSYENETAAASGDETTFYVNNPPITGDVTVHVGAVEQTETTDYTVVDARKIVFTTAPAADSMVTIEYTRQTFSDAELQSYIDAGKTLWNAQRLYVYQAAVYAIDVLMMGAATALNFGGGQENFDMVSVWERLQRTRQAYLDYLEAGAATDTAGEGEGAILVQDMLIDTRDPAYPDWDTLYPSDPDPYGHTGY